jgi:uncharacterized protein (DUF1330 family)
MPAFAIAHLRHVNLGPQILEYMRRIDDTLRPYQGAFKVHGALPQVMEGAWPGHVVVIEFPDLQRAHDWYACDAYQAILALRTDNAIGDTILVEGVERGYRAGDTADKLARAAGFEAGAPHRDAHPRPASGPATSRRPHAPGGS